MRGGTSKGIVICADNLPESTKSRSAMLIKLLGGDTFQADGLGGGHPLNSKSALVGISARTDADLDYQFMQIQPGRGVDTRAVCGNMLAAVGPFAIETGMVPATDPETLLRINDINLGSQVEVILQTPAGKLTYAGKHEIPGVPNFGAPIRIRYLNVGPVIDDKLWPTGNVCDRINGVDISLVNATIPVLIIPAAQLGWDKLPSFRDMNKREMISQILDLRDQVQRISGMDYDRSSVLPKIAVVAPSRTDANLAVRYFTPHNMHRSMAVTGAIALGYAAAVPGSTAANCAQQMEQVIAGREEFVIEHIVGTMALGMSFSKTDDKLTPKSASVVRTARMLMRGTAYLPNGE